MRGLALAGCLLSIGCAQAGFPDVMDARELPAPLGAPRITRIRDAGLARLPESGPWQGASDGVASPGELLLIEGDNFGRLPTVSIGGRATELVARTTGGGILARVPTGVPAGDVPIVVAQPKGRAEKLFPLRRLAVVVHDGELYFLRVDKEGAQPLGKPLPVAESFAVRICGGGGVAYALAPHRLTVIDLGAAVTPRVVMQRALAHRAAFVSCASDAPVAALVGESKLTMIKAGDPRTPALFAPSELPHEAHHAHAAELSPDGKLLTLLTAHNHLVVLDVESPPTIKLITDVDLMPEQKLSLTRDLAFSGDGETLWVVSGDNAASLPAIVPTRISAVRIVAKPDEAPTPPPVAPGTKPIKGARLITLWRTVSLPGAAAPLKLAVARGQPLASGSTISMPPEKAAVFLTSVGDALFKLGDVQLETLAGGATALKLWSGPPPGIMVQADINGGGGPMFTTQELMSALDVTPDAQWVVATAARLLPAGVGVSVDFGVVVSRVFGARTPRFVPLGGLNVGEMKPPFAVGDVRIQP
jgi:hypothetical protein